MTLSALKAYRTRIALCIALGVIVACCPWLVSNTRLAIRQKAAIARLRQHRAMCFYNGGESSPLKDVVAIVTGPDWVNNIAYVAFRFASQVTDDDLAVVSDLPALDTILLNKCSNITDNALKEVAEKNKRLETVHIHNCPRISEAGTRQLLALPRLKQLNLDERFESQSLRECFRARGVEVRFFDFDEAQEAKFIELPEDRPNALDPSRNS